MTSALRWSNIFKSYQREFLGWCAFIRELMADTVIQTYLYNDNPLSIAVV